MLPTRQEKRELKAILIDALRARLPMPYGKYRMEAATTGRSPDPFLNVKVKDEHGQLLTYLEVNIKESL